MWPRRSSIVSCFTTKELGFSFQRMLKMKSVERTWWLCFSQGVSQKFVIAVLMEYIRSLNQFQISVQVAAHRWGHACPVFCVESDQRVCLCGAALPVRAGDQDAGAEQPVLHAASVPPVSRPQWLQTAGEFTPVTCLVPGSCCAQTWLLRRRIDAEA